MNCLLEIPAQHVHDWEGDWYLRSSTYTNDTTHLLSRPAGKYLIAGNLPFN